MTNKNYIIEESLGCFYRVVDGVLEWQPMSNGTSIPLSDEWGAVEEDMIGDEIVNFRGYDATFSEVYKVIRAELAELTS